MQSEALRDLQTSGVTLRRWPAEILEVLEAAWNEIGLCRKVCCGHYMLWRMDRSGLLQIVVQKIFATEPPMSMSSSVSNV